MRLCSFCRKEQEDSYFTRDMLACDDCTMTTAQFTAMNKQIAEMIFGKKL